MPPHEVATPRFENTALIYLVLCCTFTFHESSRFLTEEILQISRVSELLLDVNIGDVVDLLDTEPKKENTTITMK